MLTIKQQQAVACALCIAGGNMLVSAGLVKCVRHGQHHLWQVNAYSVAGLHGLH